MFNQKLPVDVFQLYCSADVGQTIKVTDDDDFIHRNDSLLTHNVLK